MKNVDLMADLLEKLTKAQANLYKKEIAMQESIKDGTGCLNWPTSADQKAIDDIVDQIDYLKIMDGINEW